MIVGILANVNSISLNRVVSSVTSARVHTGRLKVNPAESPQRMVTKCSGKCERCATVGLCISGHRAAGIFIDFTEEHESLGINSTSTIHKSCAASSKHPTQERPALGKFKSKVLISAVITL